DEYYGNVTASLRSALRTAASARRARRSGRRRGGGERGEQLLLRRARKPAARAPQVIVAVGVHLPGLAVVGQIRPQALLDQALLDLAVEHGHAQLDAAEEIALHPVGAGEIDVLGAVVQEVEDPRVLEEAPDHRAHADVVRKPRYSGPQRAHAADDEVD